MSETDDFDGGEAIIPNLIPTKFAAKLLRIGKHVLECQRDRGTGFAFKKIGRSVYYYYPFRPYEGPKNGPKHPKGKSKNKS